MSKKKKIKNIDTTRKILPEAFIVPDEPRIEYPVFSFIHVSTQHCLLSEWKSNELIELLTALKHMESITWNQLPNHKGLDFTKIDTNRLSKPLPSNVSPEVSVYEISVCPKKRIFGYRIYGNIFRILWFDREHEVVPFRKVRRA